jgi:hypothetical protein
LLDVWLLQVNGVKKILWSGVEDGEINAVCQVLEMVNHGCCLKIWWNAIADEDADPSSV